MPWKNNSKSKTLLIHTAFWFGYLLFNGLAWLAFDSSYMYSSFLGILFLPVKMGIVYINFYWLIPEFLFKKKIILYCLLIVVIMFAGGIMQHFLVSNLSLTGIPNHIGSVSNDSLVFILVRFVVPINTIVFFTSMIKLLEQWYKQQINTESLARENVIAELNYLKAQIHPHFLFNTLNNLYSLTLKQSPKAPKMILRLSELLSYVLYESSQGEILLIKEINQINNFIALEKMRYGDRLDLSFNYSGNIDNSTIESMILIPFIENSFKHGIANEMNNVWVKINLKVTGNELNFKIENNKTNKTIINSNSKGIGLINVKRRLELLYPLSHYLIIDDLEDRFIVDLKLQLIKPVKHVEN